MLKRHELHRLSNLKKGESGLYVQFSFDFKLCVGKWVSDEVRNRSSL